MASPPYSNAGSPAAPSSLALPRQRPSLALPTANQSRKPSLNSSTSAHPLRQTSFPPSDSLDAQHQQYASQQANGQRRAQFSPTDDDSIDNLSDSEITSAISGPTGEGGTSTKRKRGEKRSRGRPPKNPSLRAGSASVVNGDDARSATTPRRGNTAGAPSVAAGDAEGEEDDEDDDEDESGGRGGEDGFTLDRAEMEREKHRRTTFREAVPRAHQDRYDAFNKSQLASADVRRLVNATLSQSVPKPVVIAVRTYAKMFAGMLIESAREAQAEWMAAQPQRPDGEENRAYKRLMLMQPTELNGEEGHEETQQNDGTPDTKRAQDGSIPEADLASSNGTSSLGSTQPNGLVSGVGSQVDGHVNGEKRKAADEAGEDMENVQPGAWGLSKALDECDRGPLLPDHLREALRRYKQTRSGGSVGFTGLSLEGMHNSAPRTGGRRLFK